MKTFITTLTFITTILFYCNAQTPLTRANNAYVAGETFIVHKANVKMDVLNNYTADLKWDFGNLLPLDTVTWQTKVTTDSAGIINGRDNITLFSNTGKNEYYSYSDSDAITINNTKEYDWVGTHKIVKYPFNYEKYYDFRHSFYLDLDCRYQAHDTLILPTQTFTNITRLKYTRDNKSACGAYKEPNHDKHSAFLWYAPNIHYPIAVAIFNLDYSPPICNGYSDMKSYDFYYLSKVINVAVENIDVSALHVNIYPNPATHTLNVYTPQATQLKVYNVLGEEVQITTTTIPTTTLNISNLPNGIYLIKTNMGQIAKFIKE